MENKWEILNFKSEFYCFLALNLLAHFLRQIVVQILSLELKKVCGNISQCTLEICCFFTEESQRVLMNPHGNSHQLFFEQ
jgi:hypothetical protein